MKYLQNSFLIIGLLSALCTITPATRQSPTGTTPPTTTSTLPPPPTSPRPRPTLTATPIIPDTGWEMLHSGLERRVINLFDDEGRWVEHIYLLRFEPALYKFDIAYHPTQPRSLAAWQAETRALAVINGGYYREEEGKLIPNGLTVVDGQPLGQSFGDFAGMFVVTEAGPDLRWLRQRPYEPEEPLLAALQSFPLLVKPDGELGFPARFEDDRQARRSVIGQDRSGRTLFFVASQGHFTLHQLSLYLTTSDLDLDIAVNLDGGTSSGILLAEPAEGVPALLPLPLVMTVHLKE